MAPRLVPSRREAYLTRNHNTRVHSTRAIQGWLGHRSITSTAVYTALASNRFKDFLARLSKYTN